MGAALRRRPRWAVMTPREQLARQLAQRQHSMAVAGRQAKGDPFSFRGVGAGTGGSPGPLQGRAPSEIGAATGEQHPGGRSPMIPHKGTVGGRPVLGGGGLHGPGILPPTPGHPGNIVGAGGLPGPNNPQAGLAQPPPNPAGVDPVTRRDQAQDAAGLGHVNADAQSSRQGLTYQRVTDPSGQAFHVYSIRGKTVKVPVGGR